MADYSALKATIDASINTNGQQAITGAILNDVLNEMVDVLGEGYTFLGVATPTTSPTTPEGKAYYLAGAAGTYRNFGNIVVNDDEVALLVWDGTAWSKVVSSAASKEEVRQLGQKAGIIALENGGIILSNGQNVSSSQRVRSGFITTPFRIECNTGYSLYAVIQYQNDGTYSRAIDGIVLGSTPNYELAKDDYLYRIVFSKTDYTQNIDVSENIITSFDARSTFLAKTKSSVTLSLNANTKELLLMVDGVATRGNYGFTFLGLATPSTNPYTPVGLRVSYLAKASGTYPNFGGLTVYSDEYAIFIWRETLWEKISIAKDSRAINGLVVLDAWAASVGAILTAGQYGWSTAQKKVIYRSFDGSDYFIDPAASCLYLYNGKYYRYVDDDMVLQDYDVNPRFDKTLQALLGITWGIGQLYSDGGADSSRNTYIISNYFPVPAGTVIKCHDVSKYGFYLARYKSDNKIEPLADNLIEYYNMASLANDADGVEIPEFCYVRVCAYQKPANTIIISEDDIYNLASHIYINMPSYDRITERMASVPNTIGLATDMMNVDDYEYTGNLFNIPYNPSDPESALVAFYNLWDELASTYPLWVTKEVLGKDATNTYDILHYSINPHTDVQINGGMGRASAKNLRILLLGGTHGSEYLAHYSMYMFVKDLLENHDNNDALSYIWYNSVLEVIPTINPYGFAHYTVTNGNGVNINRNFDINWQYIADGATKSGDAPFSEAETNIVVNFINSFSDVFLTIFPHVSGLVDSNRNIAYIMTAFRSDGNIGLVFGKTLQKYVRERYPFVFSESSIFSQALVYKSTAPGGTITGTAADWLTYHGKHGFILEVGDLWGTSFPSGTSDDLQRIYITIFGRLLRVFISKNRDVLSDNYAYIPLIKYSTN